MGNPLPPPEYGDDCLFCFAAGKTPKRILLLTSGVVVCPFEEAKGPTNGGFILPQTANCVFRVQPGPTTFIEVDLTGLFGTEVQIKNEGNWTFIGGGLVQCGTSGPNGTFCGFPGHRAHLGSFHIDNKPWPETPLMLTDEYNFLPSKDTKTDPYTIQDEPPTTMVYTFANQKYSTKVRMKFDYTV